MPEAPTSPQIQYPLTLPVKVMGLARDNLVPELLAIARGFDPTLDAATLELRPSRGGKYLGVTLTVTVASRQQLDALYQALHAHPLVKVVL